MLKVLMGIPKVAILRFMFRYFKLLPLKYKGTPYFTRNSLLSSLVCSIFCRCILSNDKPTNWNTSYKANRLVDVMKEGMKNDSVELTFECRKLILSMIWQHIFQTNFGMPLNMINKTVYDSHNVNNMHFMRHAHNINVQDHITVLK